MTPEHSFCVKHFSLCDGFATWPFGGLEGAPQGGRLFRAPGQGAQPVDSGGENFVSAEVHYRRAEAYEVAGEVEAPVKSGKAS